MRGPAPDLLTASAVARELGISRNTVAKLAEIRRLRRVPGPGVRLRYRRAEVETSEARGSHPEAAGSAGRRRSSINGDPTNGQRVVRHEQRASAGIDRRELVVDDLDWPPRLALREAIRGELLHLDSA